MKIGYLGPEGTFSQQASQVYAEGNYKNYQLIPYSKIIDVLKAVQGGDVD